MRRTLPLLIAGALCATLSDAALPGAVRAQRAADQAIVMAVGSYGDVAVVLSSEALRPVAERALARMNDTLTFVIREEPRFALDWFAGKNWKYARDYKNLLIVVDWNDGGEVVKAVEKLLEAPDLARLRQAGGGLAQMVDPFLAYQFGVLVAGNGQNAVRRLLRDNAERIREQIEKQNHDRIRRQFAREGLRDALTSRYWRQHRFLIDIPSAYRENQAQPRGFAGIEWVRNGPTRGITLTWRKARDPAAALRDRDFLLAMRREMGDVLHREDVNAEGLEWGAARLGDLPAVKLTGSWVSRELAAGGAFWAFFVADPQGGRVFCLDLLAFMPSVDEPKMPLYRELLAIAETFSLTAPHP